MPDKYFLIDLCHTLVIYIDVVEEYTVDVIDHIRHRHWNIYSPCKTFAVKEKNMLMHFQFAAFTDGILVVVVD